MDIISAVFIKSSTAVEQCPEKQFPEFAFAGRSNVGKSSLLNFLTGKKGLAKISSTPGKTQTINHFLVNDNWYIADLPGYGYAKVSQDSRYQWSQMLENYLLRRPQLSCTFILIDSRLEPQQSDLDFIHWLGEKQKPIALIFTKSDKSKRQDLARALQHYERTLLKTWDELPPMIVTSSTTRTGRDEVLDFIAAAITRQKNNH